MVNSFIYSEAVQVHFGVGKLDSLADVLAELGIEKAVIACGRHFAPQAEALKESVPAVKAVFGAVEPNPQLAGAIETARLARETGADAVIGVGGGSSLDTAKFAAAIALGDGAGEDYYRGRLPFPERRLKIVCVPTTAGTGSEVTQVSVMSHGAEKRTINHPAFLPTAAIVDPALTVSMPPRTTAISGIDAMAHALEGCWSRNHQPITDLLASESVRLILENLETAYHHGNDLDARAAMSYAALLGGMSFALPKTAGSHACSYPLSEDYHLPHGEACAFTLASFVEINADERLELLCRRAGLKDTKELAERIRALQSMAGLRSRLSDLGEVDMDKLVRDCAAHPLMGNNPVPMDEEKLRAMFEALR